MQPFDALYIGEEDDIFPRSTWNSFCDYMKHFTQNIHIDNDRKFIGLGVTEPLAPLQIGDRWTFHTGASVNFIAHNTPWDANQGGNIRQKDGGGSQLAFYDNGDVRFFSAPNGVKGSKVNSLTGTLIIKQNGDVGIKTANPKGDLQIGDRWVFRNYNNRSFLGYNVYQDGGLARRLIRGGASQIQMDNSGNLIFQTARVDDANAIINWGEALVMNNLGDISLGNGTPRSKFSVNGSINAENMTLERNLSVRSNASVLGNLYTLGNLTVADKVAIGGLVSSNLATLHIEYSKRQNFTSQAFATLHSGGAFTNQRDNGGGFLMSIYAKHTIGALSYIAFSDARIKQIEDISDNLQDLETLKKIEVVNYRYIDQIQYGSKLKKKVIGQQINEVYPLAVDKNKTDFIPDMMKAAEANAGWISFEKHGLKEGDKVRIYIEDELKDFKIKAVHEASFQVDESVKGKVFVYGRAVNDFHTVDYEALSMLNISATQELARQIEQQKQRINAIEARLNGKVSTSSLN